MPGRPTIFTPAKKDIACAILEVGASRRRAAKAAGVDESVLRYAINHDEDFAQRVAEIDANLEIDLRVQLRLHAAKSWRANVYCLEMLEKYADSEPDYDTKCKIADLEAAAKAAEEDSGATTALPPRYNGATPALQPTHSDDTPAILRYAQKLKNQAQARHQSRTDWQSVQPETEHSAANVNPIPPRTTNFPADPEITSCLPPTLYSLRQKQREEIRRRNPERAAGCLATSPLPDYASHESIPAPPMS